MTTFGALVKNDAAAAFGVPKAWLPFLLSAGLWAALVVLGRESLEVLSLVLPV